MPYACVVGLLGMEDLVEASPWHGGSRKSWKCSIASSRSLQKPNMLRSVQLLNLGHSKN